MYFEGLSEFYGLSTLSSLGTVVGLSTRRDGAHVNSTQPLRSPAEPHPRKLPRDRLVGNSIFFQFTA